MLADYEKAFQVRAIDDFVGALTPQLGFDPPSSYIGGSPTDLGVTATLTSDGRAVFPYLNPSFVVPYESGLWLAESAPAPADLLAQWRRVPPG